MHKLPRFLMVLQLPPPFHGHSQMNRLAVETLQGCTDIEIHVIPLHFNEDMTRIGRFALRKVAILFTTAVRLAWSLAVRRPKLVYFTPCASGRWALLRDAVLLAIIRAFSVPRLLHLHGLGVRDVCRRRPAMRRFFRFLFCRARIICLGRTQAEDIREVFDGEPCLLPNGIPDEDCRPLDARANGPPRLLFLSHLMRQKGILDFVAILQRLWADGEAFEADIAGGDGDVRREELERLLRESGLEARTRVHGRVEGAAKTALFERADIVVFPSRFQESFGLVVVEAMRAGRPVVASAVGGLCDIVEDGVTGLLFPIGDTERMAEAVQRLARDEHLRHRMGKAARVKYHRQYTVDQFQQGLRDIVFKTMEIAPPTLFNYSAGN